MAASASSKPSLKLFVHTSEKKVIFAEADRCAVDFLVDILGSIHAVITRFLGNDKLAGCIANACESMKKLNETQVAEDVKYMVMDDLVVKPMSFFSALALVNSFTRNVSEPGACVEKEVELDVNQVLEILRISMVSDSVLTTVFMKNAPEDVK